MMLVRLCVRLGYANATRWAIMPPMLAPTICAFLMPNASRTPTVSWAMSPNEYGALTVRPMRALTAEKSTLGTPSASKCWLRPMSRLSNRTTR